METQLESLGHVDIASNLPIPTFCALVIHMYLLLAENRAPMPICLSSAYILTCIPTL